MTVTKSKRPMWVLPLFLLTFAVTQGVSQPSAVSAEESGSTKSLLSLRFLKQQPSLLEKEGPAAAPGQMQKETQKLPQVQTPEHASNGLNRMTPGDKPRRLNAPKDAIPLKRIPEQPEYATSGDIQLSMRADGQTKQGPSERTQREMFDVNMPPVDREPSPIVGVNGLLPLIADDHEQAMEQRPIPLRKFPVETDPSDIPSYASIEKEERPIATPALDSGHHAGSYSLASAVQNNKRPTAAPQEPVPDTHSSGEHMHEINVAEMKSAMLNEIQPGVTLKKQVIENMGEPDKVTPLDNLSEVLLYSLGELGNIEITVQQSKVFSMVWVLPEPYPSEQIRKEGLEAELRGIRPILVPDADGFILGQMFPEKGVIFSFARSNEPGTPSLMVNQIAIEPITSWPFELRGERYLTISNGKAKWDLTIAVQLDPNNHRARWLLAKALLADGQLAEAQRECKFAIKLKPDQPQYNVTLAEIIGRAGYTKEARQYLDYLLPYCANMPQLKAQAEYLLGDFFRDDSDIQDIQSARKYHQAAIDTSTPLLTSTNPTMRQQAKLVQMNTFLSMALNISLSDWGDKEKNLPQWLDGAETFALNLVMDENMSRDCLVEVYVKAISSYINCPDLDGLEKWIDKLQTVADEITSQSDDSDTVRRIENRLASALYDVEQIYEYRKDFQLALQYAKKAVGYFERNLDEDGDVANLYRLANLYYQLGRLEASGLASRPPVQPDKKSHTRAANWFGKAIPLFQRIEASLDEYEQPVLGEMYVSIGVSYWAVGERDYALQITEYGVGKLENAVDGELIAEKVLEKPYENLSTMYKSLGRTDEAENYYILSRQAAKNLASGSSKPIR